MRYRFLILLFLIMSLISCEKNGSDYLGTDWNEGVVSFTGDPAVDGCGWLLLTEGTTYSLYNMPVAFLVDGLDVWFKGKELREYYGCGLQQDTYKIYEIRDVVEKPWKVRYLEDYPDRQTSMDNFSLDSVYIEGDSIHLYVGYSGGCAIHQFNLWGLQNGEDGEDLHLMLEHIGNGDPCEAYPHEWLSFCLVPIRKADQHQVDFWLRGSPVMSSLYGQYTYRY